MGAFDDLIPAAPAAGAPPVAAPAAANAFADLIPAGAAAQPVPGAQPVAAQGLPPGSGFAPPAAADGSGDPWYKRAGRYVNDAVRATANAVPIVGAWADSADAATDAALSGKSYNDALAGQQVEDAQFADQHPYSKLAADLAGAGGGTVAMLPAAGLGLGPSSTLAGMGVDTAGIGGRMATAALAQGALGGADAAARGNDVGTGAAIGAAGGAAGPVIGAAAGEAARAIKGANVPVPAALQGVPSKVVDWMQKGVGTASADDMAAAADKLGPQGFFGERTPGLLDLSQSVATNGGEGKGAIRGAYDDRFAGANDRIMSGVDSALGPTQDAGAVRQAAQDAGQAAAAPYFARAANNGASWDPTLESLSSRPAVASAMGDAATGAANRGAPWSSITLDQAGNPVGSDAAMQAYEAGQRPAVTSALADLLGVDPSTGPLAAEDALSAQRKAAADPLYDTFRGMSIAPTPQLEELLQRPSMQNAMAGAQRKALDQGRSIYGAAVEPEAASPGFDREPFGPDEAPEPPGPSPEARTFAQAVPSADGHTVVPVDVAKVDALWGRDPGYRIGPDAGGAGSKLDRAKDFIGGLQDGQPFKAPQLGVMDDGLGFDDGRHRFAAMRDMGFKVAPASMDPESLANAQRLGLVADPPASAADRFDAPPPNPEAVKRPTAPSVPRPQTLADFIKRAGGMQDPGGDLKSMGLDHLIAKPGAGLSPDAMREAAAEQGFLGADADHAMHSTGINDLLDRLDDGGHGHSAWDDDAALQWQSYDDARGAWDRNGGSAPADRSGGPRSAPGLADPGPEGTAPMPPDPGQRITGEGVDYITRAIGDNAGAAKRAGLNDDARIQTQLRGAFLDALGNHPNAETAEAYRAARQAYADPSRLIEALQGGADAFGPNTTREGLARQFGELDADAQPYFRSGAFHAASEALARRPDGGSFVDAIAGNQAMRDKLGTLATSPEAGARFNAALDAARGEFTEAQRPTAGGWADTLGQLDGQVGGPRGGFGTAPGEGVDAGKLAARDDLAAALSRDPDFAKGRQLQGEYRGINNAMDYGETAFRNTVHPNDVARDFGSMTPAEQEGAKVSARGDLDKTLRTSRNDFTALSRALQGPDGYNTAKIGTMWGEGAADDLTQLEAQERLQRENRVEVMGNSVTAGRQATKPLTEPSTNHGLLGLWSTLYNARPLDQPLSVLPKALTPEAIAERFAGNAYERYRSAAAPLLTRQGQDATDLGNALLELRKAKAMAAHGTEGVDPLVTALMAGLPQSLAQSAGAR